VIRADDSVEINLYRIEEHSSPDAIRKLLLDTWIKEPKYIKYRYFVDVLENSNRVYLERPGRLNKGCDFVIFIEDDNLFKNGNDKPPSHKYVTEDLKLKKQSLTADEWHDFFKAIDTIFQCSSYDDTLQYTQNLPIFGKSYELILKLIRWFFIEQDITYWSGRGRKMFYEDVLKDV